MDAEDVADVPAVPDADPVHAAEEAGLRYVSDARPGWRRVGKPPDFRYERADGTPITDEATVARIRSIAIPPAWTDVWICPQANGHIQATGRDAKGRKQYRYHRDWRAVRDETKFHRVLAFARALPRLRRQVEHDLGRQGLPREKVLAAVVRLLETTLIRVGNEEYARANQSYGLTTLRTDHADVHGSTVRFRFRGKSGIEHEVELHDRRLARIVQRCQDLPGQELFEYLDDDGEVRAVGSADVNAYLREATGQPFTAKDFRTWGATVLAWLALARAPWSEAESRRKRAVNAAIDVVAARLGNTRTVCRKSYVHPAVVDAFAEGILADAVAGDVLAEQADLADLAGEERKVLEFLTSRPEKAPLELQEALKRSIAAQKADRRGGRARKA